MFTQPPQYMWVGEGWASPSKLFISDLLKFHIYFDSSQAVMQMITMLGL